MGTTERCKYEAVIDGICDLNWGGLSQNDLTAAAWAYYYFSIQFRENLVIARQLRPDDEKLQQLEREECDTSNLSPWPGVVAPGERVNHDEFMRRTLLLQPIGARERGYLEATGQAYLDVVRGLDPDPRALSIASYEDGGLEKVFTAFLQAPRWDGPLLQAFRHFLTEHIRFDSDPEQGHGALSRHMPLDDSILPLWEAFRTLLITAVPALEASAGRTARAA